MTDIAKGSCFFIRDSSCLGPWIVASLVIMLWEMYIRHIFTFLEVEFKNTSDIYTPYNNKKARNAYVSAYNATYNGPIHNIMIQE